jgi:hypothetical protein
MEINMEKKNTLIDLDALEKRLAALADEVRARNLTVERKADEGGEDSPLDRLLRKAVMAVKTANGDGSAWRPVFDDATREAASQILFGEAPQPYYWGMRVTNLGNDLALAEIGPRGEHWKALIPHPPRTIRPQLEYLVDMAAKRAIPLNQWSPPPEEITEIARVCHLARKYSWSPG